MVVARVNNDMEPAARENQLTYNTFGAKLNFLD